MTYTIKLNEKFQSNEIYFDEKPSETIKESLKALKMRWNNVKKCWYGFAEQKDIKNALNSTEAQEFQTGGTLSDGYMGAMKYIGNNSEKFDYTGAGFLAAFKAHGIQGVTKRQSPGEITPHFRFTITATDADFVTPEQFAESYKINPKAYWIDYKNENGQHKSIHFSEYFELSGEQQEKIRTAAACYEYEHKTKTGVNIYIRNIETNNIFTEQFTQKLKLIDSIIKSFNFDDSNSMVDYFHTNFYYDLELKHI